MADRRRGAWTLAGLLAGFGMARYSARFGGYGGADRDRRSGVERRVLREPVQHERRSGADRRAGRDRRSGWDRRHAAASSTYD